VEIHEFVETGQVIFSNFEAAVLVVVATFLKGEADLRRNLGSSDVFFKVISWFDIWISIR
jgi:hypothetical protein